MTSFQSKRTLILLSLIFVDDPFHNSAFSLGSKLGPVPQRFKQLSTTNQYPGSTKTSATTATPKTQPTLRRSILTTSTSVEPPTWLVHNAKVLAQSSAKQLKSQHHSPMDEHADDHEIEEAVPLNASDLFRKFEIDEDFYDSRFRPNYGGRVVSVYCSAFIGSISAVSEESMDYTVDFYFRQAWRDHRLMFTSTNEETVVNIPADHVDFLWRPDTFFTKFFPLDHQMCTLSLESFSLTKNDLIYYWSSDRGRTAISQITDDPGALNRAVSFDTNASTLPHLVVFGYSVAESFVERDDETNHSRLSINLYFSRSLGFYMIQVYLPATLMVVTSWISLWISRNSAPARITLAVTTVLTVVTLTVQGNHMSSLPKISYLNALDLFLMTCFIFVFMVLVEYAIVSYLSKKLLEFTKSYDAHYLLGDRVRRMSSMAFTPEGEANISTETTPVWISQRKLRRLEARYSNRRNSVTWIMNQPNGSFIKEIFLAALEGRFEKLPSQLEVASRWLFPSCFAIFNIIYWKYYYFQHLDDIENDPGFEHLLE